MKFRDLPVGATFRFFRRGLLLTKTSAKTYSSADGTFPNQTAGADVDVIEEVLDGPEPPAVRNPFGESNRVQFLKKAVRLDGVFAAEQLEAVIAELKKQKR